jgi:hypothetical protein
MGDGDSGGTSIFGVIVMMAATVRCRWWLACRCRLCRRSGPLFRRLLLGSRRSHPVLGLLHRPKHQRILRCPGASSVFIRLF